MSASDVVQLTQEMSSKVALQDTRKGGSGGRPSLPPSMEGDVMYQRLPSEARAVYHGAKHYKEYKELALAKLKEKLENSEGYDITRPVLSYLAALQNFVSVFTVTFKDEDDPILKSDIWIQSYGLDLNFVSVVKMHTTKPVFAIVVDFRRIDAPKWKKDADVKYRASQVVRLAPENAKAIAKFVRHEVPDPSAISNTTARTENTLVLPTPIPSPIPLPAPEQKKRKRSEPESPASAAVQPAAKAQRVDAVTTTTTTITADQLLVAMGQVGVEGHLKDTELVVGAYDEYCRDPKSDLGKAFANAYHTLLESLRAWLSAPEDTHGGMYPGATTLMLALYKTARQVSTRKAGRTFADMIKLENVSQGSPSGDDDKLVCQFTGQKHAPKHMLKLVLEGGKPTETTFLVSHKKAGMVSAILGRAFALLEMARHHAGMTAAEAKDLKDALIVVLQFIRSTLATAAATPRTAEQL